MATRHSETRVTSSEIEQKEGSSVSLQLHPDDSTPRHSLAGEYERLKKRLKLKAYSEPRIYFGCKAKKANGKYLPDIEQPKSMDNEWYIVFNYHHPILNKKKQVRKRLKMNYYKDIQDRYSHARAVLKEVKKLLENGWNPFDTKSPRNLNFKEALHRALEYQATRNLSKKTLVDYKNIVENFISRARAYAQLPIQDIRRIHVREILDYLQTQNKVGNTRYNKYKTTISQMFNSMIELDIISTNPMDGMAGKPAESSEAHVPFTQDEKKQIAAHLKEKNPDYFLFTMFIYYSAVRKSEILKLQVEDIDLSENIIYLEKRKAKTKKPRVCYIPEHLRRLILSSDIPGSDPKYFLFGTDFKPAPVAAGINRPTSLWQKLVKAEKKKGGLGIDKNMYGLKHTAGDDLLSYGSKPEDVKELYGHTDLRMSKRYMTQEKKEAFKNVIFKEFGE